MLTTTGPRLVLIGAPGSGKTTVAALVAEQIGVPFVDVDARIEALAGMPRDDIFALDGEDRFRALEREATLVALREPGAVVAATSGGITDAELRDALAGLPVVWLRVDATHSSRRSGLSAIAPGMFTGMRARLIRELAERDPLYASVARQTIDTSHMDPRAVADAVVDLLPDLSAVSDPGR